MQCEHTTFGGGDKHDASYDGLLLLALKQNLNKNIRKLEVIYESLS